MSIINDAFLLTTLYVGTGKRGTVDGDFFREEYEMNYLLQLSKVIRHLRQRVLHIHLHM